MKRFFLSISLMILFIGSTRAVSAEEKQVLSVTPPLFQLSTLPGDVWQSSIKVVNANSYPLTVYAEVVNFKAVGEAGQGKFVPVENTADNATLAEWIELPQGPYTIPPEQTKDISFYADIPKDAPPGGHYAAIIISTEEPESNGGLSVRASQAVTSLLFLRVEGDVDESATIREFRVVDSFLNTPEAEFSLRFENKGNVHLQPRGDIVITNMWGTERGSIPVNYQTHYGNVLPLSVRDFSFTWKSDFKISDVGRYKAVATLAFGEDGVQSTSATTYFWVIPIKWTVITLSVLGTFIWLIVLMVRAYVRRMLALAGVDVNQSDTLKTHEINKRNEIPHSYRVLSAPIRDGVLDLRKRLDDTDESVGTIATVVNFVVQYKIFFISISALIGISVTVWLYIGSATDENQSYEIEVHESNTDALLTE